MTDDKPAEGQAASPAKANASASRVAAAPASSGLPIEPFPPRWQTGPERLRSAIEAGELRRARRRREAGDDRGWAEDAEDEGQPSTNGAEERLRWPPPGQLEWIITVLVGLYAEARSQQHLVGFNRTTRWVLEQAALRVDKEAVKLVPLKLLQALYLALGPRQRGWALWSHPATARRAVKGRGAAR